MFIGKAVRKLLLIVLTTLAALNAHAWDAASADSSPEGAPAIISPADSLVTTSPVPAPARVVQLASYSPQSSNIRQAKTLKAGKVAKSMLSRSVRGQIALANSAANNSNDLGKLAASDEDDDDPGLDDQDVHRSFSQPKVAKSGKQKDDDEQAGADLPDHIKLRLLMARTKAVEAHILAQAGKEADSAEHELPSHIQSRLAEARQRALQAHREKFGQA